jgi:regulator of replication initiation timing
LETSPNSPDDFFLDNRVEDLIERGLNLRLGFHDLKSRLNLNDVLGATFVEKRLICVDASLVENRSRGRMFFTLAHEAGHWMLHRTYIRRSKNDETAHFCRVQDAKKPVEWQADYFAACLLMPEKFVSDAFQRVFGCEHLSLHNVQAAYCGPLCFDPCIGTWPRIAAKVMEAGGFTNVSKQAMIIRLQDMGHGVDPQRDQNAHELGCNPDDRVLKFFYPKCSVS